MNNVLVKSILNKIEEETKELEFLKGMISKKYEWSETRPMQERLSISGSIGGKIGVYKIIHKDHEEYSVMYIGQGNIGNRKGRHLSVFRNDGKDIVSPNGHVSPSQAGKKMYAFDDNIDNWYFSCIILDNKKVSTEYEKLLTILEEPEFNNLSMSGKS
jgi:hypothetical protein